MSVRNCLTRELSTAPRVAPQLCTWGGLSVRSCSSVAGLSWNGGTEAFAYLFSGVAGQMRREDVDEQEPGACVLVLEPAEEVQGRIAVHRGPVSSLVVVAAATAEVVEVWLGSTPRVVVSERGLPHLEAETRLTAMRGQN